MSVVIRKEVRECDNVTDEYKKTILLRDTEAN
jgi:hypothetical protein